MHTSIVHVTFYAPPIDNYCVIGPFYRQKSHTQTEVAISISPLSRLNPAEHTPRSVITVQWYAQACMPSYRNKGWSTHFFTSMCLKQCIHLAAASTAWRCVYQLKFKIAFAVVEHLSLHGVRFSVNNNTYS